MGEHHLSPVALAAIALILGRWNAQLWLESLNRHHVIALSAEVPDGCQEIVDAATHAKSVQYTLAKNHFRQFECTWDMVVLLAVLFSGVLPRAFDSFAARFGSSASSMAAFLFLAGIGLALVGWPFEWYAQFRLEERFGFNTTTLRLWWIDRAKGLLLGILLGYPLLVLVLKLVEWMGQWWWLWAWGCLLGFQLVILVLAPVLILPLFNKFTPLPEGSLRDRLMALGERTGFRSRNIQVMDGSKRSRHSNAFFTGFGRFRKIILFDTLIQQLAAPELEAVLAHEIGHYRQRHVLKALLWSAVTSFAGFGVLSWLARQAWFAPAFGFHSETIVPALLLFALLGGVITFWFSPLARWWSRCHEYEADRYAAQTTGETLSLIGALRKLNEKNLSNLTPHPIYSGFYYSHPTLLERERALRGAM